MVIRPTATLLALALLAACASGRPTQPKQAWDRPAADTGPAASATTATPGLAADPGNDPADDLRDVTPAAYAASFPGANACEAAARRLLKTAPDKGWAVLKACVERGKFVVLARLVDGTWNRELQGRNDAAVLLARVVAARGGDILGDLATLRKARVPIFSLDAAMGNPEIYKGRVLLFRARIEEVKPLPGNKSTVRLAQVEFGARARFVEEDAVRLTSSGSSSGSISGSGSYSGSRNGRRVSGSGSGSGSYSGSSHSTSTAAVETRRIDNDTQDTGRFALARMNSIDPFFEPGRNVVVVGRFDGVRQEPGETEEEARTSAVLTLYGYFEANPILSE